MTPSKLQIHTTPIPGLLLFDLDFFPDSRGYFKENWQRAKMVELGLPDFNPIQNNISLNLEAGATRGLHAEPWDKFISVGNGSAFCVWVDLRQGNSFGQVFTHILKPNQAIFLPRGIANGYQALESNTVYTYLVNDHWYPEAKYTAINFNDSSLKINWPISLKKAVVSEKDARNPLLKDVSPIPPKQILIVGANGQLGTALQKKYPDALALDYPDIDITNTESLAKIDWRNINTIINAAAYTDTDGAETEEGRSANWNINAVGPANLAKISTKHNITLIHVSSDYVFNGNKKNHSEVEAFTPLSSYGSAKAAGDIAVSTTPHHYILRTTWLIGEGKNFVRTMLNLGQKGISPKVVSDQLGRLTFTSELVKAIDYLLTINAPFGTYNVTNSGQIKSWADITRNIFKLSGGSQNVVNVTTQEYFKDKPISAPRPLNSGLNLDKLHSTGFKSTPWEENLKEYIKKEIK